MEKFKTDCHQCGGWGKIDISQHPEPWMGFMVKCDYCDGGGWLYNDEEIRGRITDLDYMIQGMADRIKHLQWMVIQCNRGLLFDMAERFESRVETCSVGLGRLKQYRNNLKSIL